MRRDSAVGLKDLLRSDDLNRNDLELLLDCAAGFADKPAAQPEFLAGKSVAIYMNKASTRTRLASESAVALLGGTPIFIRGDDLQLGRGESIADTARVISNFAEAFIIRTYAQSDVEEFAAWASIPVINALTDDDHPTQLLADWVTIREHFGKDISGRKFTYIGDGNNVANAWLLMGATLGAHLQVVTPAGKWAPREEIILKSKEIAEANGGRVEVHHDLKSGAEGASVIYTDVWMSMGDSAEIRAEKLRDLSDFAVTEKVLAAAAKDAIFMHCLPAHRGEEVSAAVIDGNQSLVWRQAFHRRSAIQALLVNLVKRELTGTLSG